MGKKLNELINKGVFTSDTSLLDKYDFSNLFNVVNKGEKSYFNLCKNIYFDNVNEMSSNDVTDYIILEDDSWTSISYKFYNTYKLWWLICKFNGISNPFYDIIPGKKIKIPSKEMADTIMDIIKAN